MLSTGGRESATSVPRGTMLTSRDLPSVWSVSLGLKLLRMERHSALLANLAPLLMKQVFFCSHTQFSFLQDQFLFLTVYLSLVTVYLS